MAGRWGSRGWCLAFLLAMALACACAQEAAVELGEPRVGAEAPPMASGGEAEAMAAEGKGRGTQVARKIFLLIACGCAAVFLLLRESLENLEDRDRRPIHVVVQRQGSPRPATKTFQREEVPTLGHLKALVARSLEEDPAQITQTVVYNGRELTDEAMDIRQCVPGVTCGEDWIDQRVYPNHWSVVSLKHPKRKARSVSYDLDHPGLALLAFLALSIVGSMYDKRV